LFLQVWEENALEEESLQNFENSIDDEHQQQQQQQKQQRQQLHHHREENNHHQPDHQNVRDNFTFFN